MIKRVVEQDPPNDTVVTRTIAGTTTIVVNVDADIHPDAIGAVGIRMAIGTMDSTVGPRWVTDGFEQFARATGVTEPVRRAWFGFITKP